MTLSPREQEIVRLVSTGHPNKTIAHKLAISQHTVNTHVRRIFGKLGVNSRAEMVAFALQTGLVSRQTRYN
jgi:LuxR family maltose regulon positive regulatory protein